MDTDKILTPQQAWQVGEDFKQKFLDECKLAATDDEAFSIFRSMNRIHTVIENSNEEWKNKAFDLLKGKFTSEEWHRFGSSDNYGTGSVLITGIEKNYLTPTTVRYAYTLSLIVKLLGKPINPTVIEIGAGYGGQCKIIHDICHPVSLNYTIYDLPEVQLLQKRFLNNFGINPIFKQLPDEIEGSDLIISWAGWAELDKETKIEYYNKVISKCDRYFICSNYNFDEDWKILSANDEQLREYKDELCQGIIYYSKYW